MKYRISGHCRQIISLHRRKLLVEPVHRFPDASDKPEHRNGKKEQQPIPHEKGDETGNQPERPEYDRVPPRKCTQRKILRSKAERIFEIFTLPVSERGSAKSIHGEQLNDDFLPCFHFLKQPQLFFSLNRVFLLASPYFDRPEHTVISRIYNNITCPDFAHSIS